MAMDAETKVLSTVSEKIDSVPPRAAKRILEYLGSRLYERIIKEDPDLLAEIGAQNAAAAASTLRPNDGKIPEPMHKE